MILWGNMDKDNKGQRTRGILAEGYFLQWKDTALKQKNTKEESRLLTYATKGRMLEKLTY